MKRDKSLLLWYFCSVVNRCGKSMSSFHTSMSACTHMRAGMCAPLGSCLHLYTHVFYADFVFHCFKHVDAAVRLIVTVHICSIFEIYIFLL